MERLVLRRRRAEELAHGGDDVGPLLMTALDARLQRRIGAPERGVAAGRLADVVGGSAHVLHVVAELERAADELADARPARHVGVGVAAEGAAGGRSAEERGGLVAMVDLELDGMRLELERLP